MWKIFSVESNGEGPRSKFERENGQTDSQKWPKISGDDAALGIDTICFFFQHIMLFIMLFFCSNYAKKYAFCPTLC